jgi:hypothetical protein
MALVEDSTKKQLNPARGGNRLSTDGKTNIQNYGMTTAFEKNRYNIDSTSYPSDLYSNQGEYGGNYVVFYINVADDSRLLKEERVSALQGDIPPRLRGDLIGQNLNGLEATAGQALGGAIAGGGLEAGKALLTGSGSVKDGLEKAAVGGGIGAAQAGTVALASAGMARQQKRITTAIALHVPNQLNINYGMEWQTEDTMAFQAAAMGAREVGKAVATGGAKSNVLGTAGSILTSLALNGPNGGALSAASGLASNPKKEQVFKNVNFREFTFDYTFSPRTPEEAANVRKIIHNFKLHMHPEYKDLNNFVFIYPSEFDVFYYQGGTENLNLHRHPSCVLKNMSINYTPNGAFNTFDGGMPTQINVQLQFLELAILTKTQILDNF